MICPECSEIIKHVDFEITPNNAAGIGTIKIDNQGGLMDEPEFQPDDLTGPDPDPIFKCPKCRKDITEHIPNADEFWELS